MSFSYKHVLLIGATSGIGKEMADQLAHSGVNVTAVGRKENRLDAFVSEHGPEEAAAAQFDIRNLEGIQKFASDLIRKSPDIDCLVLNAGTQGHYDVSSPETIDLEKFNEEMAINYASLVAVTFAFLPHLEARSQAGPTSVIFTGTHLAVIPATVLPGYSASKAALNVFTLCLREQLKASNTALKVIEICPPPVQTELHDDYMTDYMTHKIGRKKGMPLQEFTDQAFAGLVSVCDQIIIGGPEPRKTYLEVVETRRSLMEGLAAMRRKFSAEGC